MRVLIAAVFGLMFGLGLVLSGMTQPTKVIAFLDLFGDWDPSLAFVMGGRFASELSPVSAGAAAQPTADGDRFPDADPNHAGRSPAGWRGAFWYGLGHWWLLPGAGGHFPRCRHRVGLGVLWSHVCGLCTGAPVPDEAPLMRLRTLPTRCWR